MIQRTDKQGAAMLRRLAKAARIVRTGGVKQIGDAWAVRSDTGALHEVNGECDCADYKQRGQESGGWCKHKLAVYLAQQLEQTGKPLEELLRSGVTSVITRHPAANGKAGNGAHSTNTQQGSATDGVLQARFKQLESDVYAMREALESLLTRYEADLEARQMFAPQ